MHCDCLSEWCELRAMILPPSMRRQCASGHSDAIDTMIQRIQDRRQQRAASRPEQAPQSTPQPKLSSVGTDIRAAIESATGVKLTCGSCLTYLRSLDQSAIHNVDAITDNLLLNLALPVAFREGLGNIAGQRIWIQDIALKALGPS